GGDHALNGNVHSLVGALRHQGLVLDLLQAADPARVSTVVLLLQLLAGQNSLVAVDHDHVIAAVHVGSKGNLVLATQQNSSLGSNAAEGLARGVDHIPLALDLGGFSESSAHVDFPPEFVLNSRAGGRGKHSIESAL